MASPATALARRVFPVPGGPTKRAPLGSFAPIEVYFVGLCRKSTISTRLSFASSSPATSLKLMPVSFCIYIFALDLPTPENPPPEAPIFFTMVFIRRIRKTKGSTILTIICIRKAELSGLFLYISTLCL